MKLDQSQAEALAGIVRSMTEYDCAEKLGSLQRVADAYAVYLAKRNAVMQCDIESWDECEEEKRQLREADYHAVRASEQLRDSIR